MTVTETTGTAGSPETTEAPAEGRSADDPSGRWVTVCRVEDVIPDRGVAALVGTEQVAVFLLSDPAGGPSTDVYAIDNHDPCSGANVLARGLVGSVGDRPTVASPIYKERFDLSDGTCLDGDQSVRTWPARVIDGRIEIGVPL